MQTATDPLLNQIQQRLLTLAKVETQTPHVNDLHHLFAALYHAQQTGNGVLTIKTIEPALTTALDTLQQAYPTLLGNANSSAPITLFQPFIAFRRVYLQLHHVMQTLNQRQTFTPPNPNALTQITWHFSGGGQLSDEQKLAAYSAASLAFSIITGGAGTGKTTTLTKALELILLDNPDTDIMLAAPTGKAAQRLQESLHKQLNCVDAGIRPRIARLTPQTLHRLLVISERSGRAFKNKNNPLNCQVLAIDEASMIGSDLLELVLNALPPNAKLILLGDANQLPPINAVAFFSDISQLTPHYTSAFAQAVAQDLSLQLASKQTNEDAPLANHVCRLSTAKRFAEQSLIEQCANLILERNAPELINELSKQLHPIRHAGSLYQHITDSYPQVKTELLEALPSRMILCANRQGEFGSQAINQHLDQHFRSILATHKKSEWYVGRQILIEKNYPDLRLSNGDIGCCIKQEGDWFIDFGNNHQLPIQALPKTYSLAFAITIHKSQGSEYQHIDIVLDQFNSEAPNPLITAPLIYTAVTRAQQSLVVYSDTEVLVAALAHEHNNQQSSPLIHLLESS